MGFGLCAATFQSLMNQILRPYLRKFAIVFLDDILIFSQSWKEHLDHVRQVLQVLRENALFCKPKKCTFGVKELLYLGHVLSGRSIAADPAKLASVQSWPVPRSIHQLREFLRPDSPTISADSLITMRRFPGSWKKFQERKRVFHGLLNDKKPLIEIDRRWRLQFLDSPMFRDPFECTLTLATTQLPLFFYNRIQMVQKLIIQLLT